MKIATMVKGYITSPAPEDVIYAPINLAIAIADGLAQRGHQVDYFGPVGTTLAHANVVNMSLRPLVKNSREYIAALMNIPYHSDNVLAAWDHKLAGEMFRRAAAGEYDVLHFHHPEVALPFLDIYPKVPVVYTMHDPIDADQLELLNFSHAPRQFFVSISNNQRATAPDLRYGATIYNGIDTDYFTYDPAKPRDDYLFVAARIVPEKGIAEAVQVARKTGDRLLIAGPVHSDNQPYFDKKIKPYLNGKIKWLGQLTHDEIRDHMQKAKAFLMPIMWEEPFGVTMTEAMACGTPVIAFKRGAAIEIVSDGETGFLVRDGAEMVKAIAKLPEISAEDCRNHVVDTFSIDAMVTAYETLLKKIAIAYKRG